MAYLLPLTNALVFKLLFGNGQHEDIRISLLTAVLRPPSPILDATVLNPGIPKITQLDKGVELDLLVELQDGSQTDVEMQTTQAQ